VASLPIDKTLDKSRQRFATFFWICLLLVCPIKASNLYGVLMDSLAVRRRPLGSALSLIYAENEKFAANE
jgi:hypothetical protein